MKIKLEYNHTLSSFKVLWLVFEKGIEQEIELIESERLLLVINGIEIDLPNEICRVLDEVYVSKKLFEVEVSQKYAQIMLLKKLSKPSAIKKLYQAGYFQNKILSFGEEISMLDIEYITGLIKLNLINPQGLKDSKPFAKAADMVGVR